MHDEKEQMHTDRAGPGPAREPRLPRSVHVRTWCTNGLAKCGACSSAWASGEREGLANEFLYLKWLTEILMHHTARKLGALKLCLRVI